MKNSELVTELQLMRRRINSAMIRFGHPSRKNGLKREQKGREILATQMNRIGELIIALGGEQIGAYPQDLRAPRDFNGEIIGE